MLAANAGKFDLDTFIPEIFRKVPLPNKPINWEALNIVIDNAETKSKEDTERFRKELTDAIKKSGMGFLIPHMRASYVRARLMLGDFSDYWGWEFRGAYDQAASKSWATECYWAETWMPKWGGGNVRRLLVIAEQGIGDVVFQASMLPEALIRAQEVVFECEERLHSLLARSFNTKRLKLRTERDFEDRRKDYGKIDAFVPGMDLMRLFRRSITHFPGKAYLKVDPERVKEFEKYRGRTGLAWSGRQGSVDPDDLGIENPVSIQYRAKISEIETPEIDLVDDLEGIVALCSVLSRVVTVPQSVMHFAGASGVKTEVLWPTLKGDVENQCPWDWGIRYNNGKLPWYPDVQVFKTIDEWRNTCR